MKNITLTEIANTAGVSIATVSRVLNSKTTPTNEVHREILRLAIDAGYSKNTGLKKLGNIGLLFLGLLHEDSSKYETELGYTVSGFYGRIIFGVEKAVNSLGGKMCIKAIDIDDNMFEATSEFIRENELDGLVISVNGYVSDIDKFSELCPFVLINHAVGFTPNIDTVSSDNLGGIKKAVDKLIELGHKKIGFWRCSNHKYLHDLNRLYSYKSCVEAYGLDYERVYYDYSEIDMPRLDRMDIDFQKWLKDPDRPTAIICTSDTYVFMIIKLANKYGIKIPEDLSLIGFDAIEAGAFTTPSITSVNADLANMGKHAVHLLTKRLYEKDREKVQLTLGAQLIVRESIGKAKE